MGNAFECLGVCASFRSHLHARQRRPQKLSSSALLERLADLLFAFSPTKCLFQCGGQPCALCVAQRSYLWIGSTKLTNRVHAHATHNPVPFNPRSECNTHLLTTSQRCGRFLHTHDHFPAT